MRAVANDLNKTIWVPVTPVAMITFEVLALIPNSSAPQRA
jgi:hypothetical protein